MDDHPLSGRLRGELAAFLGYLRDRELKFCILHPFPERGFLFSGDLDLQIEEVGYEEARQYLSRALWSEEPSFRFLRFRKHYFKIIEGYKLKLDISLGYALFGKKLRFVYEGDAQSVEGPDGLPYLNAETGFCFLFKKAQIKGGLSANKRRDLALLVSRHDLPLPFKEYSQDHESEVAQWVDGRFRATSSGRIDGLSLVKCYIRRIFPAAGRRNISFVGMDGAGKGTYLALLKTELEAGNLRFKCVYLGHSAFRLTLLSRIADWKVKAQGWRRRVFLVAYLFLIPLDLILRRGHGQYDILLSDRHPLFEPVFHSGFLRIYNQALTAVCPQPDLVVYLTGDAAELWERKKDIPFEDYCQRKARLDVLVQSISQTIPTVFLDTTEGEVEDVFQKLWGELARYI